MPEKSEENLDVADSGTQPTPITRDQRGCARCGTDEHLGITYLPFTYPIDMGGGWIATHWAPCPTNGEPILYCVGPAAEDAS